MARRQHFQGYDGLPNHRTTAVTPASRLSIPATAAQWLVKVLTDSGADGPALLAGTDLPSAWCDQADATLSPRQYERLLRNALDTQNDPALGFSVSQQVNYLSRYGFWGYATMSCQTLGEALETSIRYWPVTGSLLWLEMLHRDATVEVHFAPAFDFVRDDIWQFAVEKFLCTTQLSLRWLTDEAQTLQAVYLRQAPPPHAARYGEWLQCPVHFLAERNVAVMDQATLARPLVTSQPQLAQVCRERCSQALLALQGRDDLVGAIQDFVWSQVATPPSLDAVAAHLGLAARTLRRRLQERGLGYQRILDQVREAVARDYLTNTELSIEQIASLVGFSEPTTFRSTFKRWTGQSAVEVRRARSSPAAPSSR